MPDPRFFEKTKSLTLQQIAEISEARVFRGDGMMVPDSIAPLSTATERDLSFFDNVRYKDAFMQSRAGACFVAEKMADIAPDHMALLVSDNPYKSYALAAQNLYTERLPVADIASTAFVSSSAQIGKGCKIGHGAVISDGAVLGEESYIEANAVIGSHVSLGKNCRVGANASVSHAVIGDHVRIYPGCCIGQDGFGFAMSVEGHVKVPQLGRVIIEDSVEVGANSCIDRGAGPDTVIGQGTWIDNLVQIGHNVRVGKGCVIVSQVGISGSTVLEDYVVMAGQSGAAGHLRIGKGARIGAQSGIMRDVPAGEECIGSPAVPTRQFMKQAAILAKMAKGNNKKRA